MTHSTTARTPDARAAGTIYVELFRNTPEYVFLTWVHFVLPLVLTRLLATAISFSPTVSAVLALGICYSGYFAETFRAGIEGVARGHREAAHSLGMSPAQTMRRIVLPQALLVMAPAIMNQFLVVVKSSTLVSVIAVPDLMYQALRLTSIWFEPIEILSVTALVYVVIVFALSAAIKWYSDRLRARYA